MEDCVNESFPAQLQNEADLRCLQIKLSNFRIESLKCVNNVGYSVLLFSRQTTHGIYFNRHIRHNKIGVKGALTRAVLSPLSSPPPPLPGISVWSDAVSEAISSCM